MRSLLIFIVLFTALTGMAQTNSVKFKIEEDVGIPLPGATIREEGSKNVTTTGLDGEAELKITASGQTIVVGFMGPQIQFPLYKGTDSVYLNLNKRKLIFYKEGKKIKKIKPTFDGI